MPPPPPRRTPPARRAAPPPTSAPPTSAPPTSAIPAQRPALSPEEQEREYARRGWIALLGMVATLALCALILWLGSR